MSLGAGPRLPRRGKPGPETPGTLCFWFGLRFGEGHAEKFLLRVSLCACALSLPQPSRDATTARRLGARGECRNTAPASDPARGRPDRLRAAGSVGASGCLSGETPPRCWRLLGNALLSPPRRSSHFAVVMGTGQSRPNWSGDGGRKRKWIRGEQNCYFRPNVFCLITWAECGKTPRKN